MYVTLLKIQGRQTLRLNISDGLNEWTLQSYAWNKDIKVLSEALEDIERISDFVDNYNVSSIQVDCNFGATEMSDLYFLKAIKNKSAIKEIDIFVNVSSLESIYDFGEAQSLSLCNSADDPVVLDVSKFAALEQLTLNGNFKVKWLSSSKLQTLVVNEAANCIFDEKCLTLNALTVIHSKHFNLQNISLSFPCLQRLTMTQLNISSLDGIEKMAELEELNINYCSRLMDISCIAFCHKLQKLYFENVKKICDMSPLTALHNLKELSFFKCGNILSLSFLNDIPSLEKFLFTDTNIVDGDLTPCMRLKSAWSSCGKRHYNIDVKDLPHN